MEHKQSLFLHPNIASLDQIKKHADAERLMKSKQNSHEP